MKKNKTLHIYIDEAGNFGFDKDGCSRYYVISFVYSENNEYKKETKLLFSKISKINEDIEYIHCSSLIRQNDEYSKLSTENRRKIFNTFVSYLTIINVKYSVLIFDKSNCKDIKSLIRDIKTKLIRMISNNANFFSSYQNFIIHYDNGQQELSKLMRTVFTDSLKNIELSFNENMSDEILMQVADLVTTLYALNQKFVFNKTTYKERELFGAKYKFNKNYMKQINKNLIR